MAQLPERLKRIIDDNVPEHMRAYMYRMVAKEGASGKTSKTGAAGPLQFTRGTGKAYGLVGPQGDIRKNEVADIRAGVRLTTDNASILERYLNRAPTNSELALAHQQGADTAGKMLTGVANAKPENLRVNKVDPNLPPKEAASKIMNYYGFDKQVPGLSMAGMFNPNAPGAFNFSPAATPQAPAPVAGIGGFTPPGISMASNPVTTAPAAPASFVDRLNTPGMAQGKTVGEEALGNLGQIAKGFRQPSDPRLNEIAPSTIGTGVSQQIAAQSPLAQNMLTEMIKSIHARRGIR